MGMITTTEINKINAYVGMNVCRGPGWHYYDQDGGLGNYGTIIKIEGTVAQVNWQKGGINSWYSLVDKHLCFYDIYATSLTPPYSTLSTIPYSASTDGQWKATWDKSQHPVAGAKLRIINDKACEYIKQAGHKLGDMVDVYTGERNSASGVEYVKVYSGKKGTGSDAWWIRKECTLPADQIYPYELPYSPMDYITMSSISSQIKTTTNGRKEAIKVRRVSPSISGAKRRSIGGVQGKRSPVRLGGQHQFNKQGVRGS